MPLEVLIKSIALLTTQVSLLATALAALSWAIASVLKSAPIPLRELKEFGQSLQIDAIKALSLLAIYTAITSLIAWIAVLIASGA
jgi:hypothetical protein